MAHNMAVVGERDAIMPFRMVGFDVFPTRSAEEARQTIDRLANERYGVIYVTEQTANSILETVRRYDTQVRPAIILIPNHLGSLGIGQKRIQENVEKAVGRNIL